MLHLHRYAPPAQILAPATELRGSFKKSPKRKLDRAGEPQPSERLGAPPTRLKAPEKAAWNEMRESGFWLTTADQFMVEIAAGLMAKHRSGKIDNPARSLLVSTLSKLGFGLTERSKLGFRKQRPTVDAVPHFAPSGAPPLGQNTETNVSFVGIYPSQMRWSKAIGLSKS